MKTVAFDRPLYILPFDHRGSFQSKMFEEITRADAVNRIAARYREFSDIFEEKARAA
jgi:hypothetical protein